MPTNQARNSAESFVRRELPQNTLGEALKIVREEVGLSQEELANKANIQKKYLEAIESGRYDQTPGPVYVKGFLKSIAKILELSPEAVLSRFESEPHSLSLKQPSPVQIKSSGLSYHTTRLLAVGLIVLAALVYFGIQIQKIILPPKLTVLTPATDVMVKVPQILLTGQTEPGVNVQVNNLSVNVDPKGNFKEIIDLQPGVNTLVVTAQKKRSRQTVVTRRVLVQIDDVVK